jgi:hypothetical protein
MNVGLSSATENTMLKKFGRPGDLATDCSTPTEAIKRFLRFDFDVGPFRVDGLYFAVDSLKEIFAEVAEVMPEVFEQVKEDGLLCVRHRSTDPTRFSNHSWGAAIDLFFGRKVVPQGTRLTHRGNSILFPFFNRHGWYWGAGFSGDSVDTMHFELAEETILNLQI